MLQLGHESIGGSYARPRSNKRFPEARLHCGLATAIGALPQSVAAVEWYRSGMNFADAVYLAGAAAHCSKLASFDVGFVRKARGKSTCVVMKPA